jgi:hypothetical protein
MIYLEINLKTRYIYDIIYLKGDNMNRENLVVKHNKLIEAKGQR